MIKKLMIFRLNNLQVIVNYSTFALWLVIKPQNTETKLTLCKLKNKRLWQKLMRFEHSVEG